MRRPFGVMLLAALAVLAAIEAAYHTMQYLGIAPVRVGNVSFFGQPDWLTAMLWGLSCLVFLYVAYGLWTLKTWAWLYAVIIAGWYLLLGVLSLFGGSDLPAVGLQILLSAAILLYALTPGVRLAFVTEGGTRP